MIGVHGFMHDKSRRRRKAEAGPLSHLLIFFVVVCFVEIQIVVFYPYMMTREMIIVWFKSNIHGNLRRKADLRNILCH